MKRTLRSASPRPERDDSPIPVSADPREAARREEFARLVVEGQHSLMVCYRHAYAEVLPVDLPASRVYERCKWLSRDVGVHRRVQALRDEAARATIVSVAQLLQDYLDIATADPNELVQNRVDSCRHCHGTSFAYEYETPEHYAAACDAETVTARTEKREARMLPCGGMAFRPDRDPHPGCPYCFGRGVDTVLFRDTTRLSAKARKLYKGAKVTKAGHEILMHDQQDARLQIGRILGAFKPEGGWTPPPAPAPERPDGAPPADPGRAYLSLVGKP